MNKITHALCVTCSVLTLMMLIVGESDATAIYNINQFTNFNGINTYTDSFDDGIEPTSSTGDIIFASNRENGGALTLNTDDGVVINNTKLIGTGLFGLAYPSNPGSQFAFAPGLIQPDNPGFISAEFSADFGFTNNSGFGIEVGVSPQTSAYASLTVDANGRIFAGWGDDPNTRLKESDRFLQDITSDIGAQTLITLTITVDSNDMASAFFDFGSDSTNDLIIRDFTKMNLAPYPTSNGFFDRVSGGFGAFEPVVAVPAPLSLPLFATGHYLSVYHPP